MLYVDAIERWRTLSNRRVVPVVASARGRSYLGLVTDGDYEGVDVATASTHAHFLRKTINLGVS